MNSAYGYSTAYVDDWLERAIVITRMVNKYDKIKREITKKIKPELENLKLECGLDTYEDRSKAKDVFKEVYGNNFEIIAVNRRNDKWKTLVVLYKFKDDPKDTKVHYEVWPDI